MSLGRLRFPGHSLLRESISRNPEAETALDSEAFNALQKNEQNIYEFPNGFRARVFANELAEVRKTTEPGAEEQHIHMYHIQNILKHSRAPNKYICYDTRTLKATAAQNRTEEHRHASLKSTTALGPSLFSVDAAATTSLSQFKLDCNNTHDANDRRYGTSAAALIRIRSVSTSAQGGLSGGYQ